MTRYRVLVTTLGSHGDLRPFFSVGRALVGAGHAVTIAAPSFFADDVRRVGLGFHALRPDWDPTRFGVARQHQYERRRGGEHLVREAIVPVIEQTGEDTLEAAREHDVLVSHPLAMATPIVATHLSKPWLSAVLSPRALSSELDARVRSLWQGEDPRSLSAREASRASARPIDAFRLRLGVPDLGHPFFEGRRSPFGTLALFSASFARAEPDWPANVLVTGFPFYDAPMESPPGLATFLDAGPAPIVFTLGSATQQLVGDFFESCAEICRALDRRGVLIVARHAPPQVLEPERFFRCHEAPFFELFRRAAAIVHHGGIGTTADVLRAGRPMLIVPHAHDHPHNAVRTRRMGSALWIPRARFSTERAVVALRELLLEPRAAIAATRVAATIRCEDGAETAACAILRVAAGLPVHEAPAQG